MKEIQICVAIPVDSGNFQKLETKINQAFSRGAKLIEFRVDYYHHIENLNITYFKKLVKMTPIPVILTMRRKEEGGKKVISEEKRYRIIKKLILAKPAFVDIEAQLEKETIQEFYDLAKENDVGLIYSYHNFEFTPNLEEARAVMRDLERKCPGVSKKENNFILKMVFYAKSHEDNKIPFKLCEELSNEGKKIVSFCMGKFGKYSRVFCPEHGSFFTFASIGKRTASGQISISEFLTIFNKGQEDYIKRISE